jgi:chromosomal replication initiation ATPase DnaA
MTWKQIISGVYEGIPVGLESRLSLSLLASLHSHSAPGEQEEKKPELDKEPELNVKLSNIPLGTAKTHRLETWLHRGNEPWWDKVKQYADGIYIHPFLSLLGTLGTGKTRLALGIGWTWLENGRSVLYYQVEDLLDALRQGYSTWQRGDPAGYDKILKFTEIVHLLILDDLGAQHETEWAASKLVQIVDHRYVYKKPLIVTTNIALNRLPERIADRLSEGELIQLTGESFRKRKAEK